jgi:hypothetical protein
MPTGTGGLECMVSCVCGAVVTVVQNQLATSFTLAATVRTCEAEHDCGICWASVCWPSAGTLPQLLQNKSVWDQREGRGLRIAPAGMVEEASPAGLGASWRWGKHAGQIHELLNYHATLPARSNTNMLTLLHDHEGTTDELVPLITPRVLGAARSVVVVTVRPVCPQQHAVLSRTLQGPS